MKKLRIPIFWQILIAIILALFVGSYFESYIGFFSWIGDLYIKILKLFLAPLVIIAIITGISTITSGRYLRRIGLKTFAFYIMSATLAVLAGYALVNIIKPGQNLIFERVESHNQIQKFRYLLLESLQKVIPENLTDSLLHNDIIGLIFFAIIFAYFTSKIKEKARFQLIDFFSAIHEVFIKINRFIIRISPYGIFGVFIKIMASENLNLKTLTNSSGHYLLLFITILIGYIIYLLASFIATKLLIKTSPITLFKLFSVSMLHSFSIGSSLVSFPVTYEMLKSNLGISTKITSIVLPFGAIMGITANSLYLCVLSFSITQALSIQLTLIDQLIILITTLLASFGFASSVLPRQALVTIILATAQIPVENIGMILILDKLVEMIGSPVNVYSDCLGAVLIAESEGEKLKA